MDWINEKLENTGKKIRNLPLKYALLVYLLSGFLAAAVLSAVSVSFAAHWCMLSLRDMGIEIYEFHISGSFFLKSIEGPAGGFTQDDVRLVRFVMMSVSLLPWLWMLLCTAASAIIFYRQRIAAPCSVLENGAEQIQRDNLDVEISYDSRDEMGKLCGSFERMRREMVKNQEAMWEMIEEQKKINAAFAHDLRTPLTVLKGYSDFLYRYLPGGKVSREKLVSTLELMSSHIERLEHYSRTMREIRSFDEWTAEKGPVGFLEFAGRIRETARILDRAGDIHIYVTVTGEDCMMELDQDLVLEVFENLLSNAIRYAFSETEITLENDIEPGMLRLCVRDDGPGFSGEMLKEGKEPYARETHGGSGAKDHFGLGLHIADILAEKHGGTLSLANSIRGGAFASVSFSYRKS